MAPEKTEGQLPKKEKVFGLDVKEAVKIDADFNLSKGWQLNETQSDIFLLFLEGNLRMKRGNINPQDIQPKEKPVFSKGLKGILEATISGAKDGTRIGTRIGWKDKKNRPSLIAGAKALSTERYFEEGNRVSLTYKEILLKDFVGLFSKGGRLSDIGDDMSATDKNILAETMLEAHGSPDSIKRTAHLISSMYLALEKTVKTGQITNEEMKKTMEECASINKIKVDLPKSKSLPISP